MIIVAHRGASGLAPENTLPAFKKAVELGAPWVELDVHLTRDGVAVCFHDDRLDRLTPEKGKLSDWEWEPVSKLPVMPGAFGGQYPEARIPLLLDVFKNIPAPTRFTVELKKETERPALLVARTMEAILAADVLDRVRFISFEQDLLRQLRAWKADGRTGADLPIGVLGSRKDRDQMFERAREVKAVAIHLNSPAVDEAWRAQVREQGFLVNAWTVNTEGEWGRLAGLKVEEVTTDFPDRARTFFAAAGKDQGT